MALLLLSCGILVLITIGLLVGIALMTDIFIIAQPVSAGPDLDEVEMARKLINWTLQLKIK